MRTVATMPLPSFRRSALLAVLLAGTMVLSVGACGRRGRPEPPPDPNQPVKSQTTTGKADAKKTPGTKAATASRAGGQDDEDDDSETENPTTIVSPNPTPMGRKKVPAYQVPKQPFILDSIL